MNKEITIIDLLYKIANNEEMPKRIKYKDKIYIYNKTDQDYLECNKDDFDLLGYAFCNWRTKDFINDKVEILEEDKPIIQEIHLEDMYNHSEIKVIDIELQNKLNEIIDYINRKEDK